MDHDSILFIFLKFVGIKLPIFRLKHRDPFLLVESQLNRSFRLLQEPTIGVAFHNFQIVVLVTVTDPIEFDIVELVE